MATPTPDPWPITDATLADAADLAALDTRNFATGDRFPLRLWRDILRRRAGRSALLTRVVRIEGMLVAAVTGELRTGGTELSIWSIAVDTPWRGAGLAEALLRSLVHATPATYRAIVLEARRDNTRARRFYERLGFTPVKEIRGVYADGTHAIRYQIALDKARQTWAVQPPSSRS